jgi:hypothetical protein
VADWGVVRALDRDLPIDRDLSLIVTDTMLLEVIDNPDQAGMVAKLHRALETPESHRQVLVAQHWGNISLQERAPGVRVQKRAIIDEESTVRMRHYLRSGDWTARMMQGRSIPDYDHYLKKKAEFVMACNRFADQHHNFASQITEHSQDRLRPAPTVIRRPNLVNGFLAESADSTRFHTTAWRKALNVFPDHHAIGRWTRLVAYYGALRMCKRDQREDRFSNNYEDAMYAFIASYTGHLASNDDQLWDCVSVVFPWIKGASLQSGRA